MKKILVFFLLMTIGINFVYADEDILSKKSEVAKSEIQDFWYYPSRSLYTFGDKYITFDRYIVAPDSSQEWYGSNNFIFNSYDKNWNKIKSTHIEGTLLLGDNYLYSYDYELVESGYDYVLRGYDDDFEYKIIEINYYKSCYSKSPNSERPFCSLDFKDVYSDSDGIYFLTNIYTPQRELLESKILKISKDYNKYEFVDVSNQEIKELFPKYYYQAILDEYKGDNDYYIIDDKVLVSGESLRYYEKDEKIFEITSNDYVRFGKAKVYNNLIIVIGYINYNEPISLAGDYKSTELLGLNNSDVLFYDLKGNLIGTYEHNYYDYDTMLIGDELVISSLYIDGICDVCGGGYHTYNFNCKATLMNEIYDMKEKYLGMTKSTSITNKNEEIKNPETLPGVNDVILLCFIAFITLITTRLIKNNNFRKI